MRPRCQTASEYSGEATFYDFAHRSGNCSLDAPQDLLVGALNTPQYARSRACGTCARITGPEGEVTVLITDRCPRCRRGDIDLSRKAFERIADCERGRVPIRWQFVPCPVQGALRYHFKRSQDGTFNALQVRNHRHGVASVEWFAEGGRYVPLERASDNYFRASARMGDGPYTLRVSDVHGGSVVDFDVPRRVPRERTSRGQFPECEP